MGSKCLSLFTRLLRIPFEVSCTPRVLIALTLCRRAAGCCDVLVLKQQVSLHIWSVFPLFHC